jgi:terminase small subunit / prophage DNA-packing protein
MPRKYRGQTVGKREIAEIFGVADTTVDQWIRRGMPTIQRGAKGIQWQINTADVSEWLKQRAVEDVSGDTLADESELKRRKLAAETAKAELELAKVKGEVVPLRQLERALSNTFAEVKTNLRSLPSRVATSLVGESNETRIKEVILAEVDLALATLSEFDLDEDESASED